MGVLGYEPLEDRLGECGPGAPSPRKAMSAVVREVVPGSAAARAGFAPGDRVVSVNGEPIRDVIDLVFHAAESALDMRYLKSGETKPRRQRLLRAPGEELGIVLEDFKIKTCNNQCVFCFIHQNPAGLRRGIYFKDGDYRMSFLHGNYVTTTNFMDEDFQRVIDQRLSPMYVSVHTTNHELRLRMLGVKRSNDVLESLGRFAKGRIEFHTQIVLCPGWNDGKELDRTIGDLALLRPWLLSVAIVPLGLTGHREGLPRMEPVTPSFCKGVIAQVEPWQAKLRKKYGEDVLFLADEFFVTANKPLPDYGEMEVLHQLENGVGMVWEFMLPWRSIQRNLPVRIERPRKIALMTGLLGARVLRKLADRLNKIENLTVDIIPCMNGLFGPSITVSGLLSGGDFLRSIAENPGYDRYLIPGNAVRAEGQVLLDDMKLSELNTRANGRVRSIEGDARDVVDAVLENSALPILSTAV